MRVPISGIFCGMRVIKAETKGASDYAKLFILQAADKDHDAVLITVYVQSIEHIEYLLLNHSSGTLEFIDIYASQIQDGKNLVWMLEKIFKAGGIS